MSKQRLKRVLLYYQLDVVNVIVSSTRRGRARCFKNAACSESFSRDHAEKIGVRHVGTSSDPVPRSDKFRLITIRLTHRPTRSARHRLRHRDTSLL